MRPGCIVIEGLVMDLSDSFLNATHKMYIVLLFWPMLYKRLLEKRLFSFIPEKQSCLIFHRKAER